MSGAAISQLSSVQIIPSYLYLSKNTSIGAKRVPSSLHRVSIHPPIIRPLKETCVFHSNDFQVDFLSRLYTSPVKSSQLVKLPHLSQLICLVSWLDIILKTRKSASWIRAYPIFKRFEP